MVLLLLGAVYAAGSFLFVCSVCAAAALSPEGPPNRLRRSTADGYRTDCARISQRAVATDSDGLGRVYSLTARR